MVNIKWILFNKCFASSGIKIAVNLHMHLPGFLRRAGEQIGLLEPAPVATAPLSQASVSQTASRTYVAGRAADSNLANLTAAQPGRTYNQATSARSSTFVSISNRITRAATTIACAATELHLERSVTQIQQRVEQLASTALTSAAALFASEATSVRRGQSENVPTNRSRSFVQGESLNLGRDYLIYRVLKQRGRMLHSAGMSAANMVRGLSRMTSGVGFISDAFSNLSRQMSGSTLRSSLALRPKSVQFNPFSAASLQEGIVLESAFQVSTHLTTGLNRTYRFSDGTRLTDRVGDLEHRAMRHVLSADQNRAFAGFLESASQVTGTVVSGAVHVFIPALGVAASQRFIMNQTESGRRSLQESDTLLERASQFLPNLIGDSYYQFTQAVYHNNSGVLRAAVPLHDRALNFVAAIFDLDGIEGE